MFTNVSPVLYMPNNKHQIPYKTINRGFIKYTAVC